MNERQQEQKDHERDTLARVLGHLDLGFGVEHIVEGESPDFRLVKAARLVGVEVTQAVSEKRHQDVKAHRVFIEELREALELASVRAMVMVDTDDGGMSRRYASREVDAIVELVLSLLERGGGEFNKRDLAEEGVRVLSSIRVEPDRSLWMPQTSAFADDTAEVRLQRVVDRKARKLARYREAVDGPIWLIIDGTSHLAGVFRAPAYGGTIRTDFDRVFFLRRTAEEAAFELALTPNATSV